MSEMLCSGKKTISYYSLRMVGVRLKLLHTIPLTVLTSTSCIFTEIETKFFLSWSTIADGTFPASWWSQERPCGLAIWYISLRLVKLKSAPRQRSSLQCITVQESLTPLHTRNRCESITLLVCMHSDTHSRHRREANSAIISLVLLVYMLWWRWSFHTSGSPTKHMVSLKTPYGSLTKSEAFRYFLSDLMTPV